MDGIYSTDLPLVAALDEVVGNVAIDGIQRSARQSMADHAQQIAANGPIADALAAEATARENADTELDVRVDELATLPGQVASLTGRVDAVETIALSGVKSAKQSVRLLVTTATDPATMTAGSMLDGLVLAANDRVGRATPAGAAADGVYVVQAAGGAIRSADMDTESELIGARFDVDAGTHASETWALQTPTPIVVGTTVLSLVKTSSANATTAEVIAGRGGYASLSEHFDAVTGAAALKTTQTIGRPVTPVTGSALPATTYIYATPVLADGVLSAVRVFAMAAGMLNIRRYSKIGDDFSMVGDQIMLTLAIGLNTFTANDFGLWPVKAGECLGFYQNAVIAYAAGSTDSGGLYSTATNSFAFTDAAVTATVRPALGLDMTLGDVPDVRARVETIEEGNLYGLQTIGRAVDPIDGTAVTANTYVHGEPIREDGVVTSFRYFGKAAGTAYLRRFSRSGDNWAQVGSDVPVALATGLNEVSRETLGYFPVLAGEYLGLYASTALPFVGQADDWGWYSGAGNSAAFTSATRNVTGLQWGFDIESGRVGDIEGRVTTLENSSTDFYDDAVVDGSLVSSGLDVDCSITFSRNGVRTELTDSRTLAAASASNVRFDKWYYDALAGTFGVVQGTERTTDPTAFIPALTSSNHLPLFLLRVTPTTVTSVPLFDVYDGEVRSIASQMERERRRNRKLLPKTIGKIKRKASIRIVGFGDSITAVTGGNTTPVTTTPNGAVRDNGAAAVAGNTYHYLRDSYGADVVDALPLYTSVQLGRADDGAGAVHTKVGFNWELVSALVGSGYVLGTDLFYDNFGINGLATSHAVVAGVAQGWLTNAIALAGDVMVIAFGMNELGLTTTEANMVAIIGHVKAAGVEPLVLGVPRPRNATAGWEYTNRALRRAAESAGAAFLSMTPMFDAQYIQAAGITTADGSAANSSNHPGFLEFQAVGRELTKLLLG